MRDIEDDQPNAGIDVYTDAPAAGGANLLVFSPVPRDPDHIKHVEWHMEVQRAPGVSPRQQEAFMN